MDRGDMISKKCIARAPNPCDSALSFQLLVGPTTVIINTRGLHMEITPRLSY